MVLKLITFAIVFKLLWPSLAFAKEVEHPLQFSTEVEVKAPIFVGAGVSLTAYDHYKVGLKYGITPKVFYQIIGDASVEFSENESYDEVVEAAFQNNNLLQLNLQYNFSPLDIGWSIGINTYGLKSDGQAEIDDVLSASTGNDYTGLKNLLVLAGRDTSVDIDSELVITEVFASYKWDLQRNFKVDLTFGVAKVMYAEINLKTGLPIFEASPSGNQLIRDSESDLEAIVVKYGISPTIGGNLIYNF